jgi:nitrate/nitrite transporter NarK
MTTTQQRQIPHATTLFYGSIVGLHVGLLILDISPVISWIQQRYAVDYALAGWAISVALITQALSQFPAGDWGERFGVKTLLLASIGFIVISIVMRALAGSFAMLFLSRAVTGFGTGLGFISVVQLVSVTSPPNFQARDQGVLGSAQHFGTMAAMLLIPIVNETIGLELFYLVDAAILGAAFLAFALRYPTPPPLVRPSSERPISWSAAFRTRLAIELGLANLTSFTTYIAMVAWTAAFLSARFGTRPSTTGLLAMAITFFGFVARLTGGFIEQRVGPRAVIFGAGFLTVLLILSLPFAERLPLALILLFAAAYSTNIAFGPIFGSARAMSSHPGFGRRLAVIVIISNVVAFVLPLAMGYILHYSGSFFAAFWFLGIFSLTILLGLGRWGSIGWNTARAPSNLRL